MRRDVTRILDVAMARRNLTIAIGITAVAFGGSLYAIDSARRAATADAAWLRQRLTEKRALVRALQSDLAVVAEATERVSQMASMAREQNVAVRRLAQLDEARDVRYTLAHLVAFDDVMVHRSEDGARTLAQLAFMEEQFAATTDSLALMTVLSKDVEPREPAVTRQPEVTWEPVVARAPKVHRKPIRPAVADISTPGGWPVAGTVSSRFGWRDSPWGSGPRLHTGLDIRADYGTPVRVSGPGTVIFAGGDSGGYGTTIVVDHGGNVKTLYGHLSGVYVRAGQQVPRGMVIGAVGNSGRATGVHLHYEVRVGNVPVDPMLYVQRAGLEPVKLASR